MAALKDSGERRTFGSGAVRDIQEGKGRCDLLPLTTVAAILATDKNKGAALVGGMDESFAYALVLQRISAYQETQDPQHIANAFMLFCRAGGWPLTKGFIEAARQYEDGCRKYGERNWQKGIPCRCYVDSAVRHLLKYMEGWDDEPHGRAFLWNMLGCHWTHQNMPHLRMSEEEQALAAGLGAVQTHRYRSSLYESTDGGGQKWLGDLAHFSDYDVFYTDVSLISCVKAAREEGRDDVIYVEFDDGWMATPKDSDFAKELRRLESLKSELVA